ncbi:dihydropyrimidinase, partial [Mycobacterium tuberculosis]
MVTTLIRGGTVVSATGRQSIDVLIDGATIAALIEPGAAPFGDGLAERVDN